MNSILTGDAGDSLTLAATVAVRDVVRGKSVKPALVVATGASQFVYDKFLKQYIVGYAAQLTGEQYWSAMLANAVGLSAVILAVDSTGALPDRADLSEGEASVLPTPGGSGMGKKALKALVKSTELLVEQKVLVWAVSKVAPGLLPSSAPQPAQTL